MKKQRLKALLITNSVIFGLWTPIAFVFLPFIAFAYDDPTAGGILLYVITVLWLIFPFLLVVSLIASWVLYKKMRYERAKWFALLPWIHIATFIFLGLFFFEA